jgi:hypothetical protein
MPDWFEHFTSDGYAMLPRALTPSEVELARRDCAAALAQLDAASSVLSAAGGPAYGARNLLQLWPQAVALLRTAVLTEPILRVLGPRAGVVRGLYFDKPPGNSWALPWHRDLTIAVKKHRSFDTFKKPTTKAGVPHVQAPVGLLASMFTVRIHLDAVTDRNGPLSVVPGSHTAENLGDRQPVVLHCEAGDALLIRPLLLHASSHSEADHREHRRIVHLELAPAPHLDDGYEWHVFVAIQGTASTS